MCHRSLKSLTLLLALPIALALAPLRAELSPADETTIDEVRRETAELLQAVKSYGASQRDEAIQDIEIAILRLDARIEDLETRIDNEWDRMNAATRDEARASLRALHRQRIELAEWYGNLRGDSAGAWRDIKQGFSKAFSDINRAWEKALNEFSDER